MVKGLFRFGDYFSEYPDSYVLIGGAACDILFTGNDATFRATRDLDMVLIIEAVTPEFAERFWDFIHEGGYRHISGNSGNPQFYRFDKPQNKDFPKMIELFSRTDFKLKENTGITPLHIDDDISSLSAILLDENYYSILLEGKTVEGGISVLRPEYLILFKAKAYLDLRQRREKGETIDASDIKKHKKDILRLTVEMLLKPVNELPSAVLEDLNEFISGLESEPFDANSLKNYRTDTGQVIARLKEIFFSDPFYSQANQAYILKSVNDLREGNGTAHELIETDDERI